MAIKRNSWYSAIIVAAMCAASLFLHLYRINYPAQPVFDEAHFATYSGDYVTGHAFEDIHPPLGELLYASVLSFFPRHTLDNSQFVKLVPLANGGVMAASQNNDYGNYPYVALRILSALFGVALPAALYFFLRNIGVSRVGSALAGFFIIFDNALLVDSRLILMNTMFIFFGITALAVYFYHRRPSITAGVLWGCALAVKLSGIVFIGPPLIALLLIRGGAHQRKKEWRLIARFAVTAFLVLGAIIIIGTLFFPLPARLNAAADTGCFGLNNKLLAPAWQSANPVRTYLAADICQMAFSLNNYVFGDPHPAQSPWYFWPAMQIPLMYYVAPDAAANAPIMLSGNFIEWLAATISVIIALALLFRYAKNYFKKDDSTAYPMFILLGGYVLSMAPFILFVQRSTFLYHYFPSLIFSFSLLGWFIARWLNVNDWTDLTLRKIYLLATILLIVIAGFIYGAPFTYGL